MYFYSSSNQLFYRSAQCGGLSATGILSYKNKYIEKGNYAYVYVSFGSISPNENIFNAYTDINSKKVYKSNITDSERNSFRIDETNYKDFDEYKYTFKKDIDGNYYFVSIEKE